MPSRSCFGHTVGDAKFSVLIGKANESHVVVRTVRVWARQPEASLDTHPARWVKKERIRLQMGSAAQEGITRGSKGWRSTPHGRVRATRRTGKSWLTNISTVFWSIPVFIGIRVFSEQREWKTDGTRLWASKETTEAGGKSWRKSTGERWAPFVDG